MNEPKPSYHCAPGRPALRLLVDNPQRLYRFSETRRRNP
jgi:hypothetical protein